MKTFEEEMEKKKERYYAERPTFLYREIDTLEHLGF